MSKNFKIMPVYYVIYFGELIPCYLIKEGYIPCEHYSENPHDDQLYGAYSREVFCIAHPGNKDRIFTNKKEAIEILRNEIESNFNKKVRNLIEDRDKKLKRLREE